MPTVTDIAIAPVKGLGLVHPDAVHVGEDGVPEDRRFVFVAEGLTDDDGALKPVAHDGLLAVGPRWEPQDNRLALRLPEGTEVAGEVTLGEPARVRLYSGVRRARRVEGPWAEALSELVGRPVDLLQLEEAGTDAYPVSLVSTASIDRLTAEVDEPVDGRRFRMLFTINGLRPHEEDSWVERTVSIGAARVRVAQLVGRCAVTTMNPDTGERDLRTLRVIARYRPPDRGRSVNFGVYAAVEEPGTVRLGDEVTPD